jgi:hypothetical protein
LESEHSRTVADSSNGLLSTAGTFVVSLSKFPNIQLPADAIWWEVADCASKLRGNSPRVVSPLRSGPQKECPVSQSWSLRWLRLRRCPMLSLVTICNVRGIRKMIFVPPIRLAACVVADHPVIRQSDLIRTAVRGRPKLIRILLHLPLDQARGLHQGPGPQRDHLKQAPAWHDSRVGRRPHNQQVEIADAFTMPWPIHR